MAHDTPMTFETQGYFGAFVYMHSYLGQVTKFVEMGFTEDAAKAALQSVGGDENAALEKLFSG